MQDWINKLKWFQDGCDDTLNRISDDVFAGHAFLPDQEEIFDAYERTPLNQVKVVIVGDHPYSATNHSSGLAFSVSPTTNPLPQSLINIRDELQDDYGAVPPTGSLEGWADQGVFLINSALTVRVDQPDSHNDIGWSPLIVETLKLIDREVDKCVFILWGPQRLGVHLRRKHLVITTPSPSPLTAPNGFFGSRPFTKTNKWLIRHNMTPIDWSA